MKIKTFFLVVNLRKILPKKASKYSMFYLFLDEGGFVIEIFKRLSVNLNLIKLDVPHISA
jgi:hypothetical protein